MTLSVHTYITDEAGKMSFQDAPDDSETLAGFEVCRTSLYGSNLAKELGLKLLPTLAVNDIYAESKAVNQLKAEAEVIIKEAAAFAEQSGLQADYVRQRADNIRKACIRARKVQGNVVIW